jgi:hypothetical protein
MNDRIISLKDQREAALEDLEQAIKNGDEYSADYYGNLVKKIEEEICYAEYEDQQ